jgi:hypothetical protein
VKLSLENLEREVRNLKRDIDRISGGGLLVRQDLDMRKFRIVNLGNPETASDAGTTATSTGTTTSTVTVTGGVAGPASSTVNAITTWGDSSGTTLLSGAGALTSAGALSGLTTISLSGQLTSTLATGTAPFVVASTTQVANLYAARAALADTVTTNANLTGPITSVGNATSVASQTGTGSTFVMSASPTGTGTWALPAVTATSLTAGTMVTTAGVLNVNTAALAPLVLERDQNAATSAIARMSNVTTSAAPQGANIVNQFLDSSAAVRSAVSYGGQLTARTAGTVTGEFQVLLNNATAATLTERFRVTNTGANIPGHLALGASGSYDATKVLNAVEVTTSTSGSEYATYSQLTANNGSSSSANYFALSTLANHSNANALTGALIGAEMISHHAGASNVARIIGVDAKAFSGTQGGAVANASTFDRLQSGLFQSTRNDTSSATAALLDGVAVQANNRSPGTVTELNGASVGLGVADGGSGAGTVTAMSGFRVKSISPTLGTDLMTGGTITNWYGVKIDDPTSGPTYSNAPEAIHIDAFTPTSIGVRQVDTAMTNRFAGRTMFGADSAPATSAAVEISSTTGALLLPRMTTTQRDALTAANGMVIYNTTTATIQGYQAGAWGNL